MPDSKKSMYPSIGELPLFSGKPEEVEVSPVEQSDSPYRCDHCFDKGYFTYTYIADPSNPQVVRIDCDCDTGKLIRWKKGTVK